MTEISNALVAIDSLSVDVLTDDVSDSYVSKTLFAVSEFANVVRAGAKMISGETLLCANLGYGLRLVSNAGGVRHTLLFDTGTEGSIFIRNCANLGIPLGEVESIAVTHGHWDHMGALTDAIDAIVRQGGSPTVHVNPGMFNERGVRLENGSIRSPTFRRRRSLNGTARVSSTIPMNGCCSTDISTTAAKFPASRPSSGGAPITCAAPDRMPLGRPTRS
jgi:hypothetical protein